MKDFVNKETHFRGRGADRTVINFRQRGTVVVKAYAATLPRRRPCLLETAERDFRVKIRVSRVLIVAGDIFHSFVKVSMCLCEVEGSVIVRECSGCTCDAYIKQPIGQFILGACIRCRTSI